MSEHVYLRDMPTVAARTRCLEPARWLAAWRIEKYRGDTVDARGLIGVEEVAGNLLVYGGSSALLDLLIGAGGVTAYANADAYLGVGTSTTPAAATQTDLLGTSTRVAMDSTYPQHTDGTGSTSNAQCVWRATFGPSVGNHAWQEFGLFNASTGGRMLNRKVEDHGTKAADTWVLSLTVTLS